MNYEPDFLIHPGAGQDMTEIWEYIAKDSVGAARRVRIEVFDTIRSVTAFPHQGHKRPDLTDRPLRFATIREYLIPYAPEEDPLLVVAVLHGRRNPARIARILDQRQ